MKAILQSYHQGENRFSKNGGGGDAFSNFNAQ